MKGPATILSACLVLVLLTFGCLALEPDPDLEPGGIVFSDNFSSGGALDNWEVRQGDNWAIVPSGDNYVFASPRPIGDNTAQRVDLKDVQIDRTERVYLKFDLRFTESNHDNAMWFIRLTNEVGGGIGQYDIGVANVQHANALRRGIRVQIAGGDTLQQNDQWTVNDDEWYTYEIRFDGPSITLYENNAIVFNFEDPGQQLFEVVRFISVMSGIEIDNVEVGWWDCTEDLVSTKDAILAEEPISPDVSSEDEEIFSDDPISNLARGLKSPHLEERINAAKALGELGSEAAPAVQDLIEALADNQTEVVWAVRAALEQIGSAAVNDLVAFLNESDSPWTMHWSAIRVLERISNPEDTEVVAAVVGALDADVHNVRASAAGALGRLKAEDAVPALIAVALNDPEASVRVAAIDAIGAIGKATDAVVGAIGVALGDTDFSVAIAAQRALRGLGQDQERVAYAMINLLEEGRVSTLQFRDTLGRMGAIGVKPLLAALDTETEIALELIETLGNLGQKSSNIVDTLIRFAGDEAQQWEVRSAAVSGLIHIGTAEAVERLCAIFSEPAAVGGPSIAYQLLPAVLQLHAQDPHWLAEQPHVIASLGELLKDSEAMISDVEVYLEQLREEYLATSSQLYIAADGSDKWAGRQAEQNAEQTDGPFATFARALQEIQNIKEVGQPEGGITVLVREGLYREHVSLDSTIVDGTFIVKFCSYPGEVVQISGTEPIGGSWNVHSDNIYKIQVDRNYEQIFLDGIMLYPARWPNVSEENRFGVWGHLDPAGWSVMETGSLYGQISDRNLRRIDVDLTGAKLFVVHDWLHWSNVPVLRHEPGSNQIEYEKNMGRFVEQTWRGTSPGAWPDRGYYYITDHLGVLDSPGEWFIDRDTMTLYVWAPCGNSPESYSVEGAVRPHAFSNSGSIAGLEISGFHLFAAGFDFANVRDVVLEDLHMVYPSRRPRLRNGVSVTIKNSSLRYGLQGGFNLAGTELIVENCVIAEYAATQGLRIIGEPGSFNTVRGNTIYNFEHEALLFRGPTEVFQNHIFNGGFTFGETSLIQTGNPLGAGSVIRHNWVHGSSARGSRPIAIGIRVDDQGRDFWLHHNVVWNCRTGMVVKGDYNHVYNNTFFDNRSDLVMLSRPEPVKTWLDSQWPLLGAQNENTRVINNLYWRMAEGTVRQVGLPGGILSSNLQQQDVELLDKENHDFRPAPYSSLIDSGEVIPGITDDYTGQRPDVGAYDAGKEPWLAGAVNGLWVVPIEWNDNELIFSFRLAMPPINDTEISVECKTNTGSVVGQDSFTVSPEDWTGFRSLHVQFPDTGKKVHLRFTSLMLGETEIELSFDAGSSGPVRRVWFSRPMFCSSIAMPRIDAPWLEEDSVLAADEPDDTI